MPEKIRLPKHLIERFGTLERETGLIDDCKYMLYFADGWKYEGEYNSVPVRNKKEAIHFLENTYKVA